MPSLSYSQRCEDLYLACCFEGRGDGFYIDVGAGHPVYDNVSFAFYLNGWRGITVEPNPDLARLARSVRPRDRLHELLLGATAGTATFYRVDDFHGLSTMYAPLAVAAGSYFGKTSEPMPLPVTTLADLCRQHAPRAIDFLKVDVEGAEHDVLAGADFRRFRPRVVVVEALAPYTQVPAWDTWEPLLTTNGYRFALFDSLNRYYVADEAAHLVEVLQAAPAACADHIKFRDLGPALDDARHPDHRLACLLQQADMARLPLLAHEVIAARLTAAMPAAMLQCTATVADVETLQKRLFEPPHEDCWGATFLPPEQITVHELYVRAVGTDRLRTALGRIAASYAW